MAKSETQTRSLKSEEFFFDSDASLLDPQDFEMSDYPFSDVFQSKDSHMEQINTFLKNVQVLLEAARFLESAERKDGSELICAACDPFHLPLNFREKKKKDFIVNRLRQQRAEFIQLRAPSPATSAVSQSPGTSGSLVALEQRINMYLLISLEYVVCIICMSGTVHRFAAAQLPPPCSIDEAM